MSKFTVPLAVVAAGAVALAGWQNREAGDARQRLTEVQKSVAEIEAKAVEYQKEAAKLRETNALFESESEQLRQKLAGKPFAKAGGASAAGLAEGGDAGFEPVPEASGEAKAPAKGGFAGTWAKMFKDPEMKKAMRSQQAMGLQMMYGDMGKEIGLSPEKTAQLIEILTDRQLAMSEKSMEMMNGGGEDSNKVMESGKAINESREEYDKQIAEALGAQDYAKFQNYEQTLGERFALNQVQQQFTAKGMPLGDAERKSLLSIMTEERKNTPPAAAWDPSGKNAVEQVKAMQSEEGAQRALDQQRQTNQRVLNRASAILNPDQVNMLRESQEQFVKMQEMGMKMGREMMKNQ